MNFKTLQEICFPSTNSTKKRCRQQKGRWISGGMGRRVEQHFMSHNCRV